MAVNANCQMAKCGELVSATSDRICSVIIYEQCNPASCYYDRQWRQCKPTNHKLQICKWKSNHWSEKRHTTFIVVIGHHQQTVWPTHPACTGIYWYKYVHAHTGGISIYTLIHTIWGNQNIKAALMENLSSLNEIISIPARNRQKPGDAIKWWNADKCEYLWSALDLPGYSWIWE